MGIRFGAWSTALLLGSLHGLVLAALLWRAPRHSSANRCLAALLVLVVAQITPYTIGYAGFFDAWPWLSFAPFYWDLAFGPLVWLFVRQLSTPALPPRWGWHFAPAALQGAYYAAVFVQPLAFKNAFDDAVHVRWVLPLLTLGFYASATVYTTAAWRRFRAYQRWLQDHSGQREELRLAWLRRFLIATGALVGLQAGFEVVDRFVVTLNYFDRFPLYLALTALVWYLGLEGWRHAEAHCPPMAEAPPVPVMTVPAAVPTPVAERDWAAQAQRWAAQVQAGGWWREPELSLADLAQRLGTNTQYLSRALNDGLGQNYAEFINRLRVADAAGRLAGPGEVLDIALAVGFGSKASFNRAFKAYTGLTPSEHRRRHRLESGEARLES